jgi:hypothetical protein
MGRDVSPGDVAGAPSPTSQQPFAPQAPDPVAPRRSTFRRLTIRPCRHEDAPSTLPTVSTGPALHGFQGQLSAGSVGSPPSGQVRDAKRGNVKITPAPRTSAIKKPGPHQEDRALAEMRCQEKWRCAGTALGAHLLYSGGPPSEKRSSQPLSRLGRSDQRNDVRMRIFLSRSNRKTNSLEPLIQNAGRLRSENFPPASLPA